MADDRPAFPPLAAIAVAVGAVATSSILILWSSSSPATIAFFRLAFATLLLLPLVAVYERGALRTLTRRDLGLLVGVGAVLALHFGTWIASLQMTSVATSVLLVTSHPVFVALLSWALLAEPITRRIALGIGVALTGVALLVASDFLQAGPSGPGAVLAFIGGIAAGVYLFAGRILRQRLPLFLYAAIVYGSSAAFLFPFAVASGDPLTSLPAGEYLLFLAMAVGPSIMGHTLYNWSLRYVPATTVSVSLLGEPIGSILLAFLLLSQAPPAMAFIAGPVALAGIYLTATGGVPPSGAGPRGSPSSPTVGAGRSPPLRRKR